MENRNERIARLFDPYTGEDLGDPQPGAVRLLGWLTDLHDNLLAGLNGRAFNGIGAFLVMVMGATGAVIWWPGIKNWRRSMRIQRGVRFARLNWDLHSAVGFLVPTFRVDMGRLGYLPMFPRYAQFSSQLSLAPVDDPPPFWSIQRSNRGALDNTRPHTRDSGYNRRSDVVEPGPEEETAPDS